MPSPQSSLQHHCGVFGISGASPKDVTPLVVAGLHALQHRGEEAVGVVTDLGYYKKGSGLVSDVFRVPEDTNLPAKSAAIGHVRYSTAGGSGMENIQPLIGLHGAVCVAHNGTITNMTELRARTGYDGTSDTGVILSLLAMEMTSPDREAFQRAMSLVEGAWSIVCLIQGVLVVGRDPNGFRPLVIGTLGNDTTVVCSETCALSYVGAEYVRDVLPGELIAFRGGKVVWTHVLPSPQAGKTQCVFEQVYFARPDSLLFGKSVHQFRERSGEILAQECPVDGADIVIPVLDSGVPSAIGYARASGIPYGSGMVRSHYVGRTFIAPSGRAQKVRKKLSPIASVIQGKRIVVVDDSLVRGTTARELVQMLYSAGASEIHFRVASPPVRGSCFYGIDTPQESELLATDRSIEQMREFIGCSSLGFLSIDGLLALSGNGYCSACFTKKYPTVIKG